MVPPINRGPRERPKGWRGGFRKYCSKSASPGAGYGTGMYSPHVGFSVSSQTLEPTLVSDTILSTVWSRRSHTVELDYACHRWCGVSRGIELFSWRTSNKPSERYAKP